ncbi:hypothetical protein [Ferruginibacter sp. SUN106]|uniref:hypothetical protein n=1 Tax=Ferruginibacter sp. SUN106 TaxID=2978348 RepID=UPI003D35E81F
MYNYHNRTFRSVANSSNGEVDATTVFTYQQSGIIVTATYSGGNIISGSLIALVDAKGKLDMRYQHVNTQNQLMTGICISTPEILPDGKIRLHEKWQWTSGDMSKGESVIEEM